VISAPLALRCLGLLAGCFTALWLLSVARRDASVVDLFWGPAFALVAALGLATQPSPRGGLVAGLVTLWALRLALHLYLRNRSAGEDARYAAMRRSHGARFWWVSLFTVFLLQACLAVIIAAPLLAVFSPQGPAGIGSLDLVAAALVLCGIGFEATADAQLTRFRRDPANRGRVLDSGLWRYSRHPNYFGDAVVWWGLGLFGLGSGSAGSLAGPALMTFFLLRVSGVALLERTIGDRRPDYARYIASTPAFFPGWPKERPAGPGRGATPPR
jgi:steroid 5-alpha reductase family enzyme